MATDSSVFIIKNFKPFFKFNLPSQEWVVDEIIAYNKFNSGDPSELVEKLSGLRAKGLELSDTSLTLMTESDPQKQLEMIYEAKRVSHASL